MLQSLNKEFRANNIKLVAVSKTKPVSQILELYQQGQRIFGENRVVEMVEKKHQLPEDIDWHLIGHLQTNKVKLIAPFVQLIHSVDSYKLLKEINKQAIKQDRIIDVLLQFKIAKEDTKYGFDFSTAATMLKDNGFNALKNIRIVGVMGMATFTYDEQQVRLEFRSLKGIFDQLKADFFATAPYFQEISMGMSGDYKIAIEEGSTMVRIGSLIFGARN